MTSNLRVAVVGAGPAGIYASDILATAMPGVSIDLLERLPVPFGLVRYGVAPDHPRIKQIIDALRKILDRGDIRFIGNVDVGQDVHLDDLRHHYDAVVVATGAIKDVAMPVPGVELPGSFGAADFVSWYDGHPDAPLEWPLDAEQVAVVGAGNVALDISRTLIKHAEDMRTTDVPDHVYAALEANRITDVHVFARRGPAQAKFSPLELRELGRLRDVDVVVYPEDFEFDEGSMAVINSSNQTKQVVKTLTDWTLRDPSEMTASRRIHLHFLHRPTEILGEDRVAGLRTARTALAGDGSVAGTGQMHDWPVQAVYRAVGYFGSPLPGLPFDEVAGVIPNVEGRVVGPDGQALPGVYTTGWIKRGPVGLIGHTKSDANETIGHLVSDSESLERAPEREPDAVVAMLIDRGLDPVLWDGWARLDAYEQALGVAQGRDRVKVVAREEMLRVMRGLD